MKKEDPATSPLSPNQGRGYAQGALSANSELQSALAAQGAFPERQELSTWFARTPLWRDASLAGAKVEAVHAYRDLASATRHVVIRLRYPGGRKECPPVKRVGDSWVWGVPDGQRQLYNLHLVPLLGDEPVYLVEGEKCADALCAVGIPTLSLSTGCDGAEKHDLTPLADRTVVLWRDNDNGGVRWQQSLVRALRAQCALLSVDVESLGLGAKDDCVDWLARNHGATASDVLALRSSRLPPVESDSPAKLPMAASVPRVGFISGWDKVRREIQASRRERYGDADSVSMLAYLAHLGCRMSRRGDQYYGLCPGHPDTHASYTMNLTKSRNQRGMGHCKACGFKHGDVIDLHAKLRGISQGQAMSELRDGSWTVQRRAA